MIATRSQRGAARPRRPRAPVAPSAKSGAELARLWADGALLRAHQPGCACAGAAFATIDPTAVAQDVLDYLQARYCADASSRLPRFIDASAQAPEDFARWLESLDGAPLEPADKARLLGDLTVTLDSMRKPAVGFQCI